MHFALLVTNSAIRRNILPDYATFQKSQRYAFPDQLARLVGLSEGLIMTDTARCRAAPRRITKERELQIGSQGARPGSILLRSNEEVVRSLNGQDDGRQNSHLRIRVWRGNFAIGQHPSFPK
jgi:hypothetical protein